MDLKGPNPHGISQTKVGSRMPPGFMRSHLRKCTRRRFVMARKGAEPQNSPTGPCGPEVRPEPSLAHPEEHATCSVGPVMAYPWISSTEEVLELPFAEFVIAHSGEHATGPQAASPVRRGATEVSIELRPAATTERCAIVC